MFSFVSTPLKELELPKHVTKTPDELGIGCKYTNIYALPEGTEIVQKGLDEVAKREVLIIPSSVRRLEDEAFKGLANPRRIVFRDGSRLETIGKQCFQGSQLEWIAIPSCATEIMEGAFRDCARLQTVVFGKDS